MSVGREREEGGRDPLPAALPASLFARLLASPHRISALRNWGWLASVRSGEIEVSEMRGRRVAFIYPARSPRDALLPPSVHLPRRSSPPPFLFSSSSSFLSFCHSRDILAERARYNISLSSFLSLFLSLYLLCLSLATLSSLLGVFSSNRKLLEYKSIAFPARWQQIYTHSSPVPGHPLVHIMDARGHLSPFRLSRASFPPYLPILLFSRFLSVSRRVSIRPSSSRPAAFHVDEFLSFFFCGRLLIAAAIRCVRARRPWVSDASLLCAHELLFFSPLDRPAELSTLRLACRAAVYNHRPMPPSP